jgi:glutaminyl-peptide cyclotransferase
MVAVTFWNRVVSMFRKRWWLILPLIAVVALLLNARRQESVEGGESRSLIEVAKKVAVFPHDPNDFCQGLAIEDGIVYEGTGHYGRSALKKYELETGRVIHQVNLDPRYFGEGITILGDRVYQLTWKERICIVYDKHTLNPLGQLSYVGQGWGLADDGQQLYMSDGSSVIQVLDPATMKLQRKINVSYGRRRQSNLNELEFVKGELWACIWYEDRIARIDPETGNIKGWLDCSHLYPATQRDREHVLNGIAYDAHTDRLFLTGKNWPHLFEIALPSF